jgi:hypothetical protein
MPASTHQAQRVAQPAPSTQRQPRQGKHAQQPPVFAIGPARTNAELIESCVSLGYITDTDTILDPTYGLGRFWTRWQPATLVASDLDVTKSPYGTSVDFTSTPWPDSSFDAVVFDPPYKLNGTGGSHPSDKRYGVAGPNSSWQARHRLIRAGITEALRVLRPDGTLLVKCQDQVCSGSVRWQTREFSEHAEKNGSRLIDMMHLLSYRSQPANRRQLHARRNYSTLLVFSNSRTLH